MRFRTVLFDLDGTVIDSGAMILASFRHATQTVLRREIPDELLLEGVGGSTLREQMQVLDAERVDELVDVYRAHNRTLHDELQACGGMLDALARLGREGRRLGLVTSKRRVGIELAVASLPELGDLFEVAGATHDTERHKPHPDPILLALERLDARPEETAYVGDSPFDVQAAKAAGVFAVAVTWGRIHTEERLREEEPDAVVHDAEELLGIL
jgi:pyrophosphatase PpaX